MTPCWVTRDKTGSKGYNVHSIKPPKRRLHGIWVEKVEKTFCAEMFEALTGFRLSPGEGPVKVRISVKKVT